jgi:hypothetical protein
MFSLGHLRSPNNSLHKDPSFRLNKRKRKKEMETAILMLSILRPCTLLHRASTQNKVQIMIFLKKRSTDHEISSNYRNQHLAKSDKNVRNKGTVTV